MVKLKFGMNETNEIPYDERPRLIPSISAGFNAVASHIYLILPPLALDLLLWLGPHLQLNNLVRPNVEQAFTMMTRFVSAEQAAVLQQSQGILLEFFERFNLLSALSTLPVGLPSLMAVLSPAESPVAGLPPVAEIGSSGIAIALLAGCILVGLILGSLYFGAISRATAKEPGKFNTPEAVNQVGQAIFYTFTLFVLIMMLILPTMIISSLFTLISPFLGQMAIVGAGLLLVWMMVPLLFAPFGIYAYRQNTVNAIMTTTQLVRKFLPGAGWFIIVAVLLGFGLDLLWTQPAANSWLMLVGLAGHAFIYTAIIAAGFSYYRSGIIWMERNLRKAALQQTA